MSIISTAFGGVTLTGDDARKFSQQVRYGRPKKAATESAHRGSQLLAEMQKSGSVRMTVRIRADKLPEQQR